VTRGSRLLEAAAVAFVVATVVSACEGTSRPLETRLWSDTYAFRVLSDPVPPRAIEDITFRIIVQDKKTGQPIELGEGRIFGTSKDRANVNDGFAKGKEVGTYYAHVLFPTTGDWAMALQFRRDSTSKLERVDWTQTVNNASGEVK
jgi:hypothetical protein